MKRADLEKLLLQDFSNWVNSSNKTPDMLIDKILHTLDVVGHLEALGLIREAKA